MRFAYSTLSIAILSALSSNLFAQTTNPKAQSKPEAEVKLSTIVIETKVENEVGITVYSKEDLEKTPNSSKNITDFLKVNPNVQFSNEHMAASSQADLKPAEISIHGAQSFNNKFVVNGVSNSNNLDPAGSGTTN